MGPYASFHLKERRDASLVGLLRVCQRKTLASLAPSSVERA